MYSNVSQEKKNPHICNFYKVGLKNYNDKK